MHGASGSGKTTFARTLARRRGALHVELDGLFHQAAWTPLDEGDFRAEVARVVAHPSWVIDGNYRQVRDVVWPRAQAIVLLDLAKWRVMVRVARRTLRRVVLRTELWNGNRESWRNLLSRDPEKNVVLWSWISYDRYHRDFVDAARVGAPHARLVVARSPRQVREILSAAGAGAALP